MVQVAPQNYQVQQAPSSQVAPAQAPQQWQSAPQLVNPYLSTGQTNQFSQVQQYAQQPTSAGWVNGATPLAVAPVQPNYPMEYLAQNYSAPQGFGLPQISQPLVPQYTNPQQPQRQFKIDLNAPSGKDSQGQPLASVLELINSFGDGSPEVAIARIHQQLIHREDQLGEVVAYTKALEDEAIRMGQILSNPESTGWWLQYQEFHLNELPQVQQFRAAYPEATFDQYYEWLRQSNQPQAQNQAPTQGQYFPEVDPEFGEYAPRVQQQTPTFNQMNMGLAQAPVQGRTGSLHPSELLRVIDSNHFGQLFNQLA